MPDDQSTVPDFIRGFLALIKQARKDLSSDHLEALGEEDVANIDSTLDELETDLMTDPYANAMKWATRAQESSNLVVQQLGTALYDLATQDRTTAPATQPLNRAEVLKIIDDEFGPPNAKLFPYAYAVPYDLRRASFEMTSGNGVWVAYDGLSPVAANSLSWSAVTAFDFLLRGADGINYEPLFNNTAMQTAGRVVGIWREDPDGGPHVVAFETTGPVTFPGVTSPPFCDATHAIHNGVTIPGGNIGMDGDLWVKTDTGSLYRKVNGTWVPRTFALTAAQANTVSIVTGIPDADVGTVGDAAILAATGQWWRKTAPATWTEQRGLKAPVTVLSTPTYAHVPVMRLTAGDFNKGDEARLTPGFVEYALRLVLPDINAILEGTQTASGLDGADGIGVEEWFAVTHLTPAELVAAQLPNEHSGYQSPTLAPKRQYRVRARNSYGFGPYSEPISLSE